LPGTFIFQHRVYSLECEDVNLHYGQPRLNELHCALANSFPKPVAEIGQPLPRVS